MRDRARIYPILERLETIWKANDQLRLTQLLMAANTDYMMLFNMEDQELLDKLESILLPKE